MIAVAGYPDLLPGRDGSVGAAFLADLLFPPLVGAPQIIPLPRAAMSAAVPASRSLPGASTTGQATARPSRPLPTADVNPLRMSVTPAASQTRVLAGTGIKPTALGSAAPRLQDHSSR
jgi:hypothetical protein